jgi:hypothetical protein
MPIHTIIFAACCLLQTEIAPVHAENPVFNQVLEHGLELEGQTIKLPPPRFADGQTVDLESKALREVAGSDRALDDMLRDSVTAPFKIQVHDSKAPGATVRSADLWFVVYGDLKQIDPLREVMRADGKVVEVANMSFQTRVVKSEELVAAAIKPAESRAGQSEWYVHVHSKLLDRIDFEATNHVVTSRTADSIVIASRTDPSFDKAGPLANQWKSITTAGGSPVDPSDRHPYLGGISYVRIGRIGSKAGALLVEMHVAFVEPDAWFQGAPILRSKFSVAAQDQVRALRRELLKKRVK